MKKTALFFLTAAMTLSLCACGAKTENTSSEATASTAKTKFTGYASTEEVTVKRIIESLTPKNILAQTPIFSTKSTYSNTGDPNLDQAIETSVYSMKNGYFEMNQNGELAGSFQTLYFSNDPDDSNSYLAAGESHDIAPMDPEEINMYYEDPTLFYSEDTTKIKTIREEDGKYIAGLETIYEDGSVSQTDELTIDPATGHVLKTVVRYPSAKGSGEMETVTEYDYSSDQEIDYTAVEANGGKVKTPADEKNSDSKDTSKPEASDKLTFDTVDINGEPVTSDIIKDKKLVMYNYWEAFCGPCIKEMPDLQKLYEEYKDRGLLILGVYNRTELQSDAEQIVKDTGVTYPQLRGDDNLKKYIKSFVPNTIFSDNEGNVLTEDSIRGAHSYEEWKQIIEEYLQKVNE